MDKLKFKNTEGYGKLTLNGKVLTNVCGLNINVVSGEIPEVTIKTMYVDGIDLEIDCIVSEERTIITKTS